MMTTDLVRPISSMMWELRTAWATGRRVALSLDRRCVISRVEGHVHAVSPTDGWVEVGRWSVPAIGILAVHQPSLLGDSTARGGPWAGRARRETPQDTSLW